MFYLDYSQEYRKAVAKYSLTQDDVTLKSEESEDIILNSREQPIRFQFSWPHSGSYFLRQFVEYTDSLGNTNVPYGNSEQIIIVDKIGKAINDKGMCKKDELNPVIKHDFSKVACVTYQTSLALYHRGW